MVLLWLLGASLCKVMALRWSLAKVCPTCNRENDFGAQQAVLSRQSLLLSAILLMCMAGNSLVAYSGEYGGIAQSL